MKAVVYTHYGSPDVLHLEEVDQPVPTDDEVLVEVHAASVNSWDWDLVRGRPYLTRLEGLRTPKYKILGADIAGRVVAAGANVTRFQPGDEVFGDISGCGWGGFAEYVCADAAALVTKPADMTFAQAAALPQAGVLALQGLYKYGPPQRGQKVLLNGAGGGVGTLALQIVKASGAEVTCVDSAAKLDMLRALGADHVIDYAQEDFTRTGQRYDLILDVAAQRSVFAYTRVLRPEGVFVVVGGATGTIAQVALLGSWVARRQGSKLGLLIHRPNPDDLEALKKRFAAGTLRPVIDKVYPLHEVPAAIRYLGAGHALGKVVIAIAPSGAAPQTREDVRLSSKEQ